jgi:hypothetical protein
VVCDFIKETSLSLQLTRKEGNTYVFQVKAIYTVFEKDKSDNVVYVELDIKTSKVITFKLNELEIEDPCTMLEILVTLWATVIHPGIH